ncbi:putative alpha-tubulin polyglutamylase Ttll1 [Diplonema papillatum]|nr:putative alpha-tubulin polyglutamylase Ttll1 [Diplonema papillatum]
MIEPWEVYDLSNEALRQCLLEIRSAGGRSDLTQLIDQELQERAVADRILSALDDTEPAPSASAADHRLGDLRGSSPSPGVPADGLRLWPSSVPLKSPALDALSSRQPTTPELPLPSVVSRFKRKSPALEPIRSSTSSWNHSLGGYSGCGSGTGAESLAQRHDGPAYCGSANGYGASHASSSRVSDAEGSDGRRTSLSATGPFATQLARASAPGSCSAEARSVRSVRVAAPARRKDGPLASPPSWSKWCAAPSPAEGVPEPDIVTVSRIEKTAFNTNKVRKAQRAKPAPAARQPPARTQSSCQLGAGAARGKARPLGPLAGLRGGAEKRHTVPDIRRARLPSLASARQGSTPTLGDAAKSRGGGKNDSGGLTSVGTPSPSPQSGSRGATPRPVPTPPESPSNSSPHSQPAAVGVRTLSPSAASAAAAVDAALATPASDAKPSSVPTMQTAPPPLASDTAIAVPNHFDAEAPASTTRKGASEVVAMLSTPRGREGSRSEPLSHARSEGAASSAGATATELNVATLTSAGAPAHLSAAGEETDGQILTRNALQNAQDDRTDSQRADTTPSDANSAPEQQPETDDAGSVRSQETKEKKLDSPPSPEPEVDSASSAEIRSPEQSLASSKSPDVRAIGNNADSTMTVGSTRPVFESCRTETGTASQHHTSTATRTSQKAAGESNGTAGSAGQVKATCINQYVSLYPNFASLWTVYDKSAGTQKQAKPFDDRMIVEEAARSMLYWVFSVLDESDNSSDDEADEPPKVNGPKGKAKRRVAVMSAGELYTALEDALRGDASLLQQASCTQGYFTDRYREEVEVIIDRVFSGNHTWGRAKVKTLCGYIWTWRKPMLRNFKLLSACQRVNHYPGAVVLTRKDQFKRLMQRYRRLPGKTGEAFYITPESYALPADKNQFISAAGLTVEQVKIQQLSLAHNGGREGAGVASLSHANCKGVWIVKPVGMSRGRGIRIATHPAAVCLTDHAVAQRYVANPLLIMGHKFDLRLYVVVTSFQPLEAFVSKLGFARFASQPFTMDPSSFSNHFVHLTNTSVQEDAVPPPFCSPANHCKWGLSELEAAFPSLHPKYAWKSVWSRIVDCLLKSLTASDACIPHQHGCFELFGYDVLLDEDCNPWILEVNASPSLEVDTPLDSVVKTQLMRDCWTLVRPQEFDRYALCKVVARRLADQLSSKKSVSMSAARAGLTARQVWEADVAAIFPAGDPPAGRALGSFEQIAPSPAHDRVCKMMRM